MGVISINCPLIHLLVVECVAFNYELNASFQSLLKVVHFHLFSGHLVRDKTTKFIKVGNVLQHSHFSLLQTQEFLLLGSLDIPRVVLGIINFFKSFLSNGQFISSGFNYSPPELCFPLKLVSSYGHLKSGRSVHKFK